MKMVINSHWAGAVDGSVLNIINPANDELVDTVPYATQADVDAAVTYALAAQKQWAVVPVHAKADIMMKFLDLVEAHKEELARLLNPASPSWRPGRRSPISPLPSKPLAKRPSTSIGQWYLLVPRPGRSITCC